MGNIIITINNQFSILMLLFESEMNKQPEASSVSYSLSNSNNELLPDIFEK